MKVLIVEDEHKIAQSIKKGLAQENYTVDLAFDGEVGLDLATEDGYDVIILDLMLPKMDGVTLCRQLRQRQIHTPILMLTALSALADKLEGFDSGADDYLPKPFAFEELLARLRALTSRPPHRAPSTLSYDDLSLDPVSFTVYRAGEEIKLTRKEFALLEFFLRHPDQILSKEQIVQHVWDYEADVLPNTVEVYLGYLRNKVDKPFRGSPPLIQTVRGFGYRLGGSRV